jgi:hypothetical protein
MERYHTPNRPWVLGARFKRTALVVSRSLERVALTTVLCAKFQVHGDDGLLLTSLNL